MNGIVNFYKPKGMTSHDAVNFFRRLYNLKRVGHTGTLDPNVTGVLPICIGKATRVSEYILAGDKEYVGELTLGAETDSQDIDGEIVRTSDKIVTEKEIRSVFSEYKGEISQIPPMYSAVRHKGKKLYELAREGLVVERKPRKVNIYDLDILDIKENKKIMFYTHCSKGSYMRTLCHDIGNDLGTHGYMSYLIRIGVGDFSLNDAYSKEYLESLTKDELEKILLPIDFALKDFKSYDLDEFHYGRITNGVPIRLKKIDFKDIDINEIIRVYCKGKFIGTGRITENEKEYILKMDKVFI